MSTKNKIIGLLEQNRSSYVSGQELADQIGISRAAIWKIINQLKQEGYEIDSSNGKGYLLKDSNDILSEEAIRLHLDSSLQKKQNHRKKFAGVNEHFCKNSWHGIGGARNRCRRQ